MDYKIERIVMKPELNRTYLLTLTLPTFGIILSVISTMITYYSMRASIRRRESVVSENILNDIVSTFESRITERQTAVTMSVLNSNITKYTFNQISDPSLDNIIGSSLSVGWCPRVEPEEREEFTKMAEKEYEEIGYDIRTFDGYGNQIARPVNDLPIYPLLYSRPLSLTYLGFDFYIPGEIVDLAIETRKPVVSDRVILEYFGGVSNFVDDNFTRIDDFEHPVSFLLFHAVFNEIDGVHTGIVVNSFEPRTFISDTAKSFQSFVTDMHMYVFKKKNHLEDGYELVFDLISSQEGNQTSTLTTENVKNKGKNSYEKSYGNKVLELELVIVLNSGTVPNIMVYLSVLFTGLIFTSYIWYIHNGLRKKAEDNIRLSEAKSKFLAEMSHELRTPLNGIIGMIEIIEGEELSETVSQCVDDLKTCGSMLLSIISEVLDFSKIEAGKLQISLRKVEVRHFILSTMSVMKFYRTPGVRRYPIKLRLFIHECIPKFLISDFDKIGKIIMNLVGNALKFTNKGEINVNVYLDQDPPEKIIGDGKSKFLRICVIDTGCGMTPKSVSNLFTPFSQLQLGRVADGGTGLGLVICKSFAESLGGIIECESHIDQGTMINTWIKVDIDTLDQEPSDICIQEEWTIEESGNSQTFLGRTNNTNSIANVLIVDDADINIRVTGKLLEKLGESFHFVNSGEEAIEKCKYNKYELILLDYFMGGLDGVETSIIIKSDGINNDTRIVIVTANECDDKIKNSGCLFLQKPITKSSLISVL